jgi:hypothetical protein
MKKNILLFIIALVSVLNVSAQTTPNAPNLKKYKMVIQLTNGDTAVHRATVKQMFNALTAAPNTKIEIVCHNNGISFLQSANCKRKALFLRLVKTLCESAKLINRRLCLMLFLCLRASLRWWISSRKVGLI